VAPEKSAKTSPHNAHQQANGPSAGKLKPSPGQSVPSCAETERLAAELIVCVRQHLKRIRMPLAASEKESPYGFSGRPGWLEREGSQLHFADEPPMFEQSSTGRTYTRDPTPSRQARMLPYAETLMPRWKELTAGSSWEFEHEVYSFGQNCKSLQR